MGDIGAKLVGLSLDEGNVSTGAKLSFQEFVSLISQASTRKFSGFLEILIHGDIQGLYRLFVERDPFVVSLSIWAIVGGGVIAYWFLTPPSTKSKNINNNPEPQKIELRDFTGEQLRDFNGETNPSIYIGLKGDVYDLSSARDMYGPGSSYNCFAGRNATRALAKLSFEEDELNNPCYDDLGAFDKETLENWVEKFRYRGYPVVGKISVPPSGLRLTRKELKLYNGEQSIPPGRVHPPIYIALNGTIFDVSYGGYDNYCVGGSYHLFAGADASRALGKMSLSEEDVENSDISDFTDSELESLQQWEERFRNGKKYPVIGKLILQGA